MAGLYAVRTSHAGRSFAGCHTPAKPDNGDDSQWGSQMVRITVWPFLVGR